MEITITIDKATLKTIESEMGDCTQETVKGVIDNILERYLTAEYISFI